MGGTLKKESDTKRPANLQRTRRKEQGLCIYCGGPIEPERKGKLYCGICARKNSERRKDACESLKSINCCTKCGKQKEPSRRDRLLCETCANDERKKNRPYVNVTRKKQREQGLCMYCGKEVEPEREGKTYCKACARKASLKAFEKRETRKMLGLCTLCGKPKEGSKLTVCRKCAEQRRKYQETRNAAHKKVS